MSTRAQVCFECAGIKFSIKMEKLVSLGGISLSRGKLSRSQLQFVID